MDRGPVLQLHLKIVYEEKCTIIKLLRENILFPRLL